MTAEPVAGSYEILGRTVTMPVEVRHARMAAASYLVDHAVAQRMIDATGLRVTRQRGGKAIAALSLIDYIDNDLGDYNEIALAFVVDQPAGQPPLARGAVATHIHRLPVNQEFTCAAGKGIWGFPKWVADIDLDVDARGIRARLVEDGTEVLSAEMRRGPIPLPNRSMEMACYSVGEDGGLIYTAWTTHNSETRVTPMGTNLVIGSGHAMAEELRSLGLPKRPLMTMFTGRMAATFAAPVTLG